MLILFMFQKDINVRQKSVLFLGKSVRASNKAYPIFGVDYSKLFFMKSPCHTRIVWQIRFDLTVACLVGIKAPNSLLVRTSLVGVALVLFWIVVKFCVAWCFYCCCCCLLLLCFLLLYSLATFYVGYLAVTNVTFTTLYVGFTTLYVGFCFPLCRDCRDV